MFDAHRRRRAQTLATLAETARSVAAGDLNRRVPVTTGDPELADAVAAFNAMVDHLSRTRRELVHQALHDPLTGLPNRTLFADRVGHALARTRGARALAGPIAVLFVDLDGFKQVNDEHGHEAGDALLVGVTARLNAQLRPHDTVARLGGDEFAVLLDDLHAAVDAERVAERLVAAVSEPMTLPSHPPREVRVGASVGIALSGRGTTTGPEELLRHADAAMYAAKTAGKGCHRTFEPGLEAAAAEQATLEAELRTALADGALTLVYEPVVDLATRRLAGLQARVRWQRAGADGRPETVPEARVRELADAGGLAVSLGRWTLAEACRQVVDLRTLAEAAGQPPADLWLSLPPRLLGDPCAVTDVAFALRSAALPAGALVLAVPEGLLTGAATPATEALADLAALGVRVAVDGFGTGGAGLAHLRSLPLTALRLDPRLLVGGPGSTLVRAAIALARALELDVAVEGIEHADQAAGLHAAGCALGQGPLLGVPAPHAALSAQLAALSGAEPTAV
jgi:diguanylate cyclase (GGDEF)-like protein